MAHLDDEQVIAAARAGRTAFPDPEPLAEDADRDRRGADPGEAASQAPLDPAGSADPVGLASATPWAVHLRDCSRCAGRVRAARALADAAAQADAAEIGALSVPFFDALIAPALRAPAIAAASAEPGPVSEPERSPSRDAAPLAPVAPSTGASWRLTAQLVWRQARLVPQALWPLTAVGFAAVLVLAWQAGPLLGAVLLGPGVTLLVVAGALTVCEPRRDPRRELLFAMPVSPVAVWLARLTFVLAVDLAMATGASVLLAAGTSGQVGPWDLISSWLGPALLSAALAAFGAVWRSPLVGAGLGCAAWAVGVFAATRANGGPLGVLADVLWSTGPVTLGAAAALLAATALLVSRPARTLPEG